MFNHHSNSTARFLAILLTLIIAAFALPACDDSDSTDKDATGGGNNGSSKNASLVIKNDAGSVTYDAGVTMQSGHLLSSTGNLAPVFGGVRAYQEDGKTKTSSVLTRFHLVGTPDQKVEAGTYTLVNDLFDATSDTMNSTLIIESLGLDGSPKNVSGTAGKVELKSITYDGDTATSIAITFDGTFRSFDQTDTTEYKLSGTITAGNK